MVKRRLEFLKAVRFGRYVLDGFVCWASCEGLYSSGSISISSESLKTKSVVQRRLEILKAVRFGTYILNELVRWASYEGLHSSRRIFISR